MRLIKKTIIRLKLSNYLLLTIDSKMSIISFNTRNSNRYLIFYGVFIHFPGVTNKIRHCLRFPSGNRHRVPAIVSQTRTLVLVSHTS